MTPTKGKKYAIACLGPYDYNVWKGVAEYTGIIKEGLTSDGEPEDWYEFILPDGERVDFASEDIIAEIAQP